MLGRRRSRAGLAVLAAGAALLVAASSDAPRAAVPRARGASMPGRAYFPRVLRNHALPTPTAPCPPAPAAFAGSPLGTPVRSLGGPAWDIVASATRADAYAAVGAHVVALSIDPREPIHATARSAPLPGQVFAVAVDGDVVYAAAADPTDGSAGGLAVLDAGAAVTPSIRADLVFTSTGATDVALSGDLLFAALGGPAHARRSAPARAAGLRVFDVTDPLHPAPLGVVAADGAWRIAVAGEFVYLAVDDADGGVAVIDARDPTRPTLVGELAVRARDLAAAGDRLYVAADAGVAPDGAATGALAVFDLTDPRRPLALGTIDDGGGAVWWGVAVAPDGTVWLTGQRDGEPQLAALQAHDPQQAQVTGRWRGAEGSGLAVAVEGDRIIVAGAVSSSTIAAVPDAADAGGIVRLLAVREASAPVEAGWWQAPGARVLAVNTDASGGLWLLEGDPAAHVRLWQIDEDTIADVHLADPPDIVVRPGELALAGEGAWLAGTYGVSSYVRVGSRIAPSGTIVGLPEYLLGLDLALLGVGMKDRLILYDVSEPRLPRPLGDVVHPSVVAGVRPIAVGRLVFIPTRLGVAIVDVVDPWAPTIVGLHPWSGVPTALAQASGAGYLLIAYGELADDPLDVEVVDVRRPNVPRVAGHLVDRCHGVALRALAAGVTSAYGAPLAPATPLVFPLDLADPATPRLRGRRVDAGVPSVLSGGLPPVCAAGSDPDRTVVTQLLQARDRLWVAYDPGGLVEWRLPGAD